MTVLPLVTFPNKILCTKAPPATPDQLPDLIQLLADMSDTMFAKYGIGLAAQQVGRLARVLVVDTGEQSGQSTHYRMINPVITIREKHSVHKEGCLSMPGLLLEVPRAAHIGVHYRDFKWRDCFMQAQGALAHVIQHEIDHLDGLLMTTRVSRLKRDIALRDFPASVRIRGY